MAYYKRRSFLVKLIDFVLWTYIFKYRVELESLAEMDGCVGKLSHSQG